MFPTKKSRPSAVVLSLLCAAVFAAQLPAQTADDIQQVAKPDALAGPGDSAATGNRWVLILCGLPGDEEFAEQMTDAIEKLYTHAPACLDTTPDHLRVLAGTPEMAEALEETTGPLEVTTNETVEQMVQAVRAQIAPADSLWVFVIGHADLQGRSSRWNISGTDPDQKTFSKWFHGIECREKVFWITTSLSGFFIRNLSGPETVVISATEADLEISATDMPYALADILAGDEDVQAAGDRDEDGKTSLLDLYLAVCHEVADRYASENLYCTEHAMIDDNADRRGTELQQRYLPEELGGKPDSGRQRAKSLDGTRAAQIALPNLPVAKPKPAEEDGGDSDDEDSESDE